MSNASLYSWLEHHCRTYRVTSYLEIGTREGDSLRAVVTHAHELARIVCCDTWGNDYGGSGRGSAEHIHAMLSQMLYTGELACVTGDSKATVPALRGPFDLVLVDGDHSYAGGMADLVNVWPLVAPGGFVAFHDITHPAHPDLMKCFTDFIDMHKAEVSESYTVMEPYGVGVVVKS